MITTFHAYSDRGPFSAANALLTLWLTTCQGADPDELADAHETCLRIAINGFAPFDVDTRQKFRVLFLHQLASDFHRLPNTWLNEARERIIKAGEDPVDEGPDLVRLAKEIVPELLP